MYRVTPYARSTAREFPTNEVSRVAAIRVIPGGAFRRWSAKNSFSLVEASSREREGKGDRQRRSLVGSRERERRSDRTETNPRRAEGAFERSRHGDWCTRGGDPPPTSRSSTIRLALLHLRSRAQRSGFFLPSFEITPVSVIAENVAGTSTSSSRSRGGRRVDANLYGGNLYSRRALSSRRVLSVRDGA